MAKLIASFLPQSGHTYVEPFAGHGNVFWAASTILNYESWWINDISTAPMFEAIRSIGDTVEIPARSKEEYYLQWELAKQGDERALILEPYLTFGGGGYGSAGPGGKKSAKAEGYTATMRRCHEIMHRTNVLVTDLDYLSLHLENLTENDVCYIDPPYKEADVRSYAPGTLNHTELVGLMQRMKCKWMLSEFLDPLYVDAFGEPCYKKDLQLNSTNFAKDEGKGTSRRIECLWKNF